MFIVEYQNSFYCCKKNF